MALPSVAIVGRPNVGKSSLFNMLARRRTSIVDPTAGVTRDRVTTICDIDDVFFELIDTGGHGIIDVDDLTDHVEYQIQCAIGQAHLILFTVDAREGISPLDRKTAELLRASGRADSVRLIANKVDEPRMEDALGEFVRLGFGEALPVSALHGNGRHDLRELILETVRKLDGEIPDDPVMKVALVGKRNAGKSTFVNALAGQDRVIVSEVPGTTRDSIDVRIEKDGRIILLIDTAGVRKKARMSDDVEFYAYTRATKSIRRADVVMLLIDAEADVGHVDKRLARLISDEHKPCVLVINKWDLAKDRASTDDYGSYLEEILPEVRYAPVAFTSANAGRNTLSTLDLCAELFKQARTRVTTGELNRALRAALDADMPKAKRGKKTPKFYFATQVSTEPPTIVLFVNGAGLVTEGYQRFLRNRFHESLPFQEIPIRLLFRSRRQDDAPA